MQHFGFKIIDKNHDHVINMLQVSNREKCPVEVGLYVGDNEVRDLCRQMQENIDFNLHFDHRAYTLIELEKYEDLFANEVAIGKAFGAKYGVHHMAKYPMTTQSGYRNTMITEVVNRMLKANELAKKYNFPIYIENSFESSSFYKEVFEKLYKHQTDHLHYCFDIGHAKVWGGDRFDDWLSFMLHLKEMGFHIHFHLHTNRGLIDEHLSMIEMEELGFDGNDDVFSSQTYLEMLRTIQTHFPDAPKVYEVKPHLALQNREWIRTNLF